MKVIRSEQAGPISSALGIFLLAGLALAIGLASARWLFAALYGYFDYDEVMHAHIIWRILQGHVPFHDFFESHPPFAYYFLALPALLMPGDPLWLIAFRFLSLIGHLLFLYFLCLNHSFSRRYVRWVPVSIGVLLVLTNRAVLGYLVEFRPDCWGNALLMGAVFRFQFADKVSPRRRCLEMGALSSLAVLLNPKLAFFPCIYCLLDLAGKDRTERPWRPCVAGYGVGIASGLGASIAFLLLAGISPIRAFHMTAEYNSAWNANTATGYGLLNSVMAARLAFSVSILGGLSWCLLYMRKKISFHPFPLSILVFAVVQALAVAIPFKQYYSPWLLLTGSMFSYFLVLLGSFRKPLARVAELACLALVIQIHASEFARYTQTDESSRIRDFYKTMLELTGPRDFIATYPPYHPIFRKDTFFGWYKSFDPREYGTEKIMQEMNLPGLSERFTIGAYSEELEQHPPKVVLFDLTKVNGGYLPGQRMVLRQYLEENVDLFRMLKTDFGYLWVRKEAVPGKAGRPYPEPRKGSGYR